jgi:sentrin-specific protease 1
MRVRGITISLKDALCLNHGKWLNDTIIDSFILLIKQAQREVSFPSYNNWLMPLSLLQQMYQDSFDRVKQYTSNERIHLYDFDAVIFVVNHELHWRTIVMKPKSITLEVYDSLQKKSHVALSYEADPSTALVMTYVSQEMELNERDQSSWSMSYMHCPQQQNGFDCGVHVCLHLLALAFNNDITYESILMDDFRLYILYCLHKGKLIF